MDLCWQSNVSAFFFCLCFLICSLVLSLVMDREARAVIHGISKNRTRLRDWSDLRFVIAFLLRSKCLLISWLQSPSAVVLEPKKIKSISISNRNSLFPLFPHLFVMKWWDQMQAEQTTSAKPLWWEHIWWVWGTAWGASVARAELRLDGILDLERLATALQCWHLDTPLLEQATKYEETMWGQK